MDSFCFEQEWDKAREKLEEEVKKTIGQKEDDAVRIQEFDVSYSHSAVHNYFP